MPPVRRFAVPAALAAVSVAALAVVLAPASPVAADAPGPHQPIGGVVTVTAPSASEIEFTGWSADPDAPDTNVVVIGVVDGQQTVSAPTSVPRPGISRSYHIGPTPGFVLDVPVAAGNHTVCLIVQNIGIGLDRVTRCVFTPYGRTPSSAELATHSPRGAITRASAWNGDYHLVGWTTDPDYLLRPLQLAVYVDGQWARDALTGPSAGFQPPPGATSVAHFDVNVPISAGAHIACVWVVNVGPGSNSLLGCPARDTRGYGSGTVTPPPVNAQIVAEAKKHIGQDYVWGAEGPTTFDCSGLVMYSYSKFQISTPRVSEDQFQAARVINPARAVPGDLVFYHDSTGDVYHVGIYLAPGQTVAAIDTAEGVDYQPIWDPSSASYASFTHD